MRIAFASSNGRTINRKFGQANRFSIWDIGPDHAICQGSVGAVTTSQFADDRNSARASAIASCAIVCSLDISVKAMAKVVANRVFHLKTGTEESITEIIGRLQNVMKHNPPPWMRKTMREPFGMGDDDFSSPLHA